MLADRKLRVFMRLAADLAGLSHCRRKQVGAAIVTPDMSAVLAIGYNGPPSGRPNDSCRGGEGACGCIHAEANALVKLEAGGRGGLVLLTTLSPCEHCAGLIVNSKKIESVVYAEAYRDAAGLKVLGEAKIETAQATA